MAATRYKYIIIGGGLAGGYAAEGIREVDPEGSVLLIASEPELPYDRPPLTKKLWFGQKKVEEIYIHDAAWYEHRKIQFTPATQVKRLDPGGKAVVDQKGTSYRYDKLLLATGGVPRHLSIPGADLAGVCYYRYLSDYKHVRAAAREGTSAVVIGGGFIGSEIAAALQMNKVTVTMVYPQSHIVARVFPPDLAYAIQEEYRRRGITIHTADRAESIDMWGDRFVVRTQQGHRLPADIVIVGIGIVPETILAEQAGLTVDNGVVVNEYLQTSHPDIYAAGDVARFPYQALGRPERVEHWDNAVNQGKQAGRNLAGAGEKYDYLPYFFSDLFEFGYEAVGDVNPRLGAFFDWKEEFRTGVVYYLQEARVRGVMLCNVWGKVDAARELIRRAETVTPESLVGAIPFE